MSEETEDSDHVASYPEEMDVEFIEGPGIRTFQLPTRTKLTTEEAITLAENILQMAGSERLEQKYPPEEGYVTVRPGNFADDCAQEIAEVISKHYDEVPEELIQRVKVEVEEVTEVTFADPDHDAVEVDDD